MKGVSVGSLPSLYNWSLCTRVEAGSNTSTMTLRVIGGDEKGSLKTESVKYGRESEGTPNKTVTITVINWGSTPRLTD
jgi:hypothetical protein